MTVFADNAVFQAQRCTQMKRRFREYKVVLAEGTAHLNSYLESITMDCTRVSKSAREGT